MLLHAKIYCPDAISTMLWSYALKAFTKQLNELNLDYYWVTPSENFSGTRTDITLKIIIHRSVQFLPWMQDYKATYLAFPSGNLANVQGSILVTHHFIQYL